MNYRDRSSLTRKEPPFLRWFVPLFTAMVDRVWLRGEILQTGPNRRDRE